LSEEASQQAVVGKGQTKTTALDYFAPNFMAWGLEPQPGSGLHRSTEELCLGECAHELLNVEVRNPIREAVEADVA
jgi:hypothetical protein